MKAHEQRQRGMRRRIVRLAASVCVLAGAVVYRAYDLQVRRAPELKEKAEAQYLRDISLAPKRGVIYDRSGAELAISVDVDSVWANPRQLRAAGLDPTQLAKQLVPLLDVDEAALIEKLATKKSFVWVKRRVSAGQAKAVQALAQKQKLAVVGTLQEARRYYPNRELAAHLLGYANIDGVGIEGLELKLEDTLRGAQHTSPAVLDRRGSVVFSEQLLDDRSAQGNEVTLTIDKTLQHIAEHELELAVRTAEAHAGSLVMLDPVKGELLAVANYPTFNANEPQRVPSSDRRNRAITDRFEPGSTMKPFTMAGALAANAISPAVEIDCENGSLQVADKVVHDTHRWEMLRPAEILAVSSNIGMAKIGIALGRAGLHRSLSGFGFGQATGLGLPGETAGILSPYRQWYDMDAATIAFGQGMSSSTLQLAMAMGALANRGRLMEPLLVKRVVDGHGRVIEQGLPKIRRQVVPEGVARLLTDMLVGATGKGGTGEEAAIEGYLVAGKTGTAQKADYVHRGYSKDKWTSSFVGYAPAQKPRLVVAVVLDEPMIAHQGGAVAAPAFRRVMEASLRHLGVAPDAQAGLAEQMRSRSLPPTAAIDPLQLAAAVAELVPVPFAGKGEAVVPNLVGRSARDALVAARRAQFLVRLHGSGVVALQEPAALTVAQHGATLDLTLTSQSFDEAPAGEVEPVGTAELEQGQALAPALLPERGTLISVGKRRRHDG